MFSFDQPVFVTADALLMRLGKPLVVAALEGIKDVTEQLPEPVEVHLIGHEWDGRTGNYESVEWFADRARMPNGQLNLDQIMMDLIQDPIRREAPHTGYMLFSEDLGSADPNINFLLGQTISSFGLSAQSMARYVNGTLTEDDAVRAARHLARHEFAHLLGLDHDEAFENPDLRGGIYRGHCSNPCTMRQVMSVQENVKLARALESRSDAGFCAGCANHLRHFGQNPEPPPPRRRFSFSITPVGPPPGSRQNPPKSPWQR
ncbi:MAG: hypothetical protein HOQ05_07275 [Corynebacteriales bacterium]|nr:hypothetical protein [Mycobacteriales bacterium]